METTTTGMKTTSLDMSRSGKRENYLITDRILRVLHYVRMYTGLPTAVVPSTEVFFYYYFFYEIYNTISIQIYLYPNPAAFQRQGLTLKPLKL